MRRAIVVVAAAIAALLIDTASFTSARAQPRTVALTNGRWFNGATFDRRPVVYSAGGRLSFATPVRVDETIDLAGGWVVPPFADAHNHNISNGAGA